MTIVTLMYSIGVFERKRFRRLLEQYECTYKEYRGVIDKPFYVTAEIDDHVRLAKEFYRA